MQRADLQYWRMHHSRPSYVAYYSAAVLEHACRVGGHSLRWLVRPDRRTQSAAKVHSSAACLARLLTLRLRAPAPVHREMAPTVGAAA
jgi:hypothetical protein